MASALEAHAQPATYPARPVRIMVPFSPGGASDTAARIIGQKLAERWGQQIVVENRPGAGGTIGTELAAKAQADGYSLLMGSSTELAVNPHLYSKLSYDTTRDFVPIARIASTPLMVVVHPAVPAKTLKEFVALAKQKPGELNYASSGNGATTHLAAEMLKRAAAIDVVHVPYNGSAPAIVAVLGGEAKMSVQAVPAVLGNVRSAKLRGLAVTAGKRVSAAPELPTLADSGYPGAEIVIWNALVAPAGVPRDVIAKLSSNVLDVLRQADVVQSFAKQGAEMTPAGPGELGAYLKAEIAKFARVVKESGAKID
ncbi:MAG TPA: tripartite tricarboxylate transporter substrate binding protein [Burkholderiales bacterium]|nr:tripartite tricarboxylate transporter substrate binding protein [Burkholderiales bacterium]